MSRIIECVELGAGMGLALLTMFAMIAAGKLLAEVMVFYAKELFGKLKNRPKKGES